MKLLYTYLLCVDHTVCCLDWSQDVSHLFGCLLQHCQLVHELSFCLQQLVDESLENRFLL